MLTMVMQAHPFLQVDILNTCSRASATGVIAPINTASTTSDGMRVIKLTMVTNKANNNA